MEYVIPPNLKSKPLSRLVVEAIRDSIFKNELKPGDMLPTEAELTKQLGVSKSSVREAIKMLEAIGIVEIRRGQGTILSQNPEQGYMNVILFQLLMQDGSAQELKTFRRMVETSYIALAIESATEADIACIEGWVERFAKDLAKGVIDVEDDIGFHRAILTATHNRFVISLGEAMTQLYSDSIQKSIQLQPEHALSDHRMICRAIKERDLSLAKDCVDHSIDLWADTLHK